MSWTQAKMRAMLAAITAEVIKGRPAPTRISFGHLHGTLELTFETSIEVDAWVSINTGADKPYLTDYTFGPDEGHPHGWRSYTYRVNWRRVAVALSCAEDLAADGHPTIAGTLSKDEKTVLDHLAEEATTPDDHEQ